MGYCGAIVVRTCFHLSKRDFAGVLLLANGIGTVGAREAAPPKGGMIFDKSIVPFLILCLEVLELVSTSITTAGVVTRAGV